MLWNFFKKCSVLLQKPELSKITNGGQVYIWMPDNFLTRSSFSPIYNKTCKKIKSLPLVLWGEYQDIAASIGTHKALCVELSTNKLQFFVLGLSWRKKYLVRMKSINGFYELVRWATTMFLFPIFYNCMKESMIFTFYDYFLTNI